MRSERPRLYLHDKFLSRALARASGRTRTHAPTHARKHPHTWILTIVVVFMQHVSALQSVLGSSDA